MEIGGFSILSWLFLFALIGVAGWVTSIIVVWLLTIRLDGKEVAPDNPLIRYRWVIQIIASVTYFVLLGNAVEWRIFR